MEVSSGDKCSSVDHDSPGRQKLDLDSKNLKFFKEEIFRLPFDKLGNSASYKHFQHVFTDEEDYEDFKQELVNFHRSKARWKDERKKVSKERRLTSFSDQTELPNFDDAATGHSSFDDSSVKQTSKDIPDVKSPDDTSRPLKLELDVEDFFNLGGDTIPMMEFFQNDEHFQEFDRVFATFKNKRNASNSSLDKYRWSPHPEDEGNQSFILDDDLDDESDFPELKINDLFADFFDNDTDFKQFEEEFDKFQKRRSQVLEKCGSHRASVCDLIEDLKAFCDTDQEQVVDKSNSLKVSEPLLGLPNLWSQGGEWDYIFNKIRRNGKIGSSESSGTGRSDLTVTCDSESGNNLLTDLGDCNSDCGCTCDSDNKCRGGDLCACTLGKHKDCQFTCHHKCLSLIQLDCKSVSHDSPDEGMGDAPQSDLSPAHQSSEISSSEPATEKDETDSGYRSGTIPDEKLPYRPSQATLNREELKKKISEYNRVMPGANFAVKEEELHKEEQAFQGFIKVTLNLVRPISMSLGARPPSIYEVLTHEHIVEQNTQHISFYMPRDTVRSIHAQSNQTTKEVVTLLLKKFHILDHPRKFALYEQELRNNKIAKIRRVKDNEYPLSLCLTWELDNINNHRLVLQENETGEVDWDAFCVPELNNFLRVLDREEDEYVAQLKYKYKVMKRLILQRMKELRLERERQKRASVALESTS